MVSTTQIKPAPILQPFVRCYALRIFNTGNLDMPQPMHAVHECYMTFFLKDRYCDCTNAAGAFQEIRSNSLVNLLTHNNGCVNWHGNYALFCVQFKANGIAAIFGVEQKELINVILPLDNILGNDNELLTGQFCECAGVNEMAFHMNAYLTKMLQQQKQKAHTITIALISDIINTNKGMVSLDALAYHANMSTRNFERRFVDEVGMTPKLYARITRFYNAVESKMLHPGKKWTDIAYENGYFDQGHFIKEVKEFSSKTPEELFNYTPPPTEKFINGEEK